jgi:ADP-ribose pyrophosphatase YjhB (NUDIX family)
VAEVTEFARAVGGPEAVAIRPASTVMLVRDGRAGPEAFTLQRASSMPFAAGMTAFPGGGVDPSDVEPDVPWSGPHPNWWAAGWRIDAAAARGQVVAAVRELFEETGVLLAGQRLGGTGNAAGHGAGAVAARDARHGTAHGARAAAVQPTADEIEAARTAITAHERSMASTLRSWNAPLRAEMLRPWARWITPVGPPRRYDTYFFVAALPTGARARLVTTEAAAGGWRRPADVLRAAAAWKVGLLPPTMAMMTDLAEASSADELMTRSRVVEPVTPTVLTDDGEVLRVRAGGHDYTARMRRPPGA